MSNTYSCELKISGPLITRRKLLLAALSGDISNPLQHPESSLKAERAQNGVTSVMPLSSNEVQSEHGASDRCERVQRYQAWSDKWGHKGQYESTKLEGDRIEYSWHSRYSSETEEIVALAALEQDCLFVLRYVSYDSCSAGIVAALNGCALESEIDTDQEFEEYKVLSDRLASDPRLSNCADTKMSDEDTEFFIYHYDAAIEMYLDEAQASMTRELRAL
jgi:hypothetical protein